MEGDGKNARATRRHAQVVIPTPPLLPSDREDIVVDDTAFSVEEAPTNEGPDPVVQNAIASLRRVQAAALKRASDITARVVRKKTPLPPRQ